jgi:hypothetical protein
MPCPCGVCLADRIAKFVAVFAVLYVGGHVVAAVIR